VSATEDSLFCAIEMDALLLLSLLLLRLFVSQHISFSIQYTYLPYIYKKLSCRRESANLTSFYRTVLKALTVNHEVDLPVYRVGVSP